jgi:acetyl esterase/lipase
MAGTRIIMDGAHGLSQKRGNVMHRPIRRFNKHSVALPVLLVAMLLCFLMQIPTLAATVISNIPYRTEPDAPDRCTLDIYLPGNTTNPPLLVWFHGGSLIEGHKADDFNVKVAEGFSAQGMAVAMVNYRLSPDVQFPVYVEDAAAAIAWALRHASDHGLDPARVFVGGHSAGGYLALMATLDPSYLHAYGVNHSAISGIISLSAQTLTHSTVLKEQGSDESGPQVDAAAPLHFTNNRTPPPPPPLLLLCADKDVPARVEENQLLAALLRLNPDNTVVWSIIPDRDHMSLIEKANQPTDPVIRAMLEFMASGNNHE